VQALYAAKPPLLLLLLLLLAASGYVPGGSGTTIHNTVQYNTQKTQNNTYTLKTIHNAIIKNTITQNYKHNAQKKTRSI
jgi:hypothetical protein